MEMRRFLFKETVLLRTVKKKLYAFFVFVVVVVLLTHTGVIIKGGSLEY